MMIAKRWPSVLFLMSVMSPLLVSCVAGDRDGSARRPFTINGMVTVEGTGVAGVTVTFTGDSAPGPVTTDANGAFRQTGFAPGSCTVTASHPSYDIYVYESGVVSTQDLLRSAAVDVSTNPLVLFIGVPAGASLSVLSPNGGEAFLSTSTVGISWRARSLVGSSIAVEYRDDAMSWHAIANGIPVAANGIASYDWHPDVALTVSQCCVRVRSELHSESVFDLSDGAFSITSAATIHGACSVADIQLTVEPMGVAPPAPEALLFDSPDLLLASGTASGGTSSTLVDPSGLDASGLYAGARLRIIAGSSAGEESIIASYDGVARALSLVLPLSAPVDSTSVYELVGPSGWFESSGFDVPAMGARTYRITPTKIYREFVPAHQDISIDGPGHFWLAEPFVATDTPSVIIAASDDTAGEGGGDAGEFTVTRIGNTSGDLTVELVVGGSATAGADYAGLSGTITIPDSSSSATLAVSPLDDMLVEGAEMVIVAVLPGAGYIVAQPSDARVLIVDDDIPGVTVSPLVGLTTSEGGATASFTVVLDTVLDADVQIALSSSDPSEGTVSPASVTFTPVDWNIAQTITMTGVDDAIDDDDVIYTAVLAPATSADTNYDGLDAADVSVTNTDDDTAGITVSPTSGLLTSEAGASASFTVVLESEPTADVTIGLSSSDAGEGSVTPASLTFTPGNWSVAQSVTLTGVDDWVDDGDVGYAVLTAAAASADAVYAGMNADDVAAANADDDTAGISVSPTSGLVTTEAGVSAAFQIVLDSEPTANVTIDLSSSDTSEGTVSPVSLVFTSADWNIPHSVTLTGVDDWVDDGDIGYAIATAPAGSADMNYVGMNAGDVTATNADDDAAGITVSPLGGLVTSETGTTDSFTIVLHSEPTANVTISLSSTDASESTVSPATITFLPGTWSAPQTVTATGIDDYVVDGDALVVVVTSAVMSLDSVYNGLAVGDVAVTNLDDDVAGITVSAVAGLVTTEAGGSDAFTIVLDTQPSGDVTISLSTTVPSESSVGPAALTFTGGNWNIPQTVTVSGVDDWVDDGDVGYTVVTAAAVSADIDYSGMAVANVAGTNLDDDTAGIAVSPTAGLVTTEAGLTAGFDVVLDSEPIDTVTIVLSSSDGTEAAVSPASLSFTAVDWDTPQTVTLSGIDDGIDDGDVAYTVVTGAATSTDPNYGGINAADVSATNVDNDTAGITVSPNTGLVTTEAGGTDTFTVVLDCEPTAGVAIGISSDDIGEGVASPVSLTFTPGNWSLAQTVTVSGVNDDIDDTDVAYTIVTAAASSTDLSFNGIDPPDIAVTNTDDDTAGITVIPVSGLTTSEAGGSDLFTVVLNSEPTADVTIALSSSNPSEGAVSPVTLTFTAVNWNAAQTVTVSGVDDALADGDVAYTVVTGQAASADGSYSGRDVADVAVVNADDGDAPEIEILIGASPVANGTGSVEYGTVEVLSASAFTFTVSNASGTSALNLTGAPRVELSGVGAPHFAVTVQPPASVAEGGSATFDLEFAPSASGTHTATVMIANDDADESPYTFSVVGIAYEVSTPQLVPDAMSEDGSMVSIAADPGSANMYICYRRSDGTVQVARSTNLGANWAAAHSGAAAMGANPWVAVDSGGSGATYVTYGSAGDVYCSLSLDGGGTWGGWDAVTGLLSDPYFTAVAAQAGEVEIVFATGGADLTEVNSNDSGTTWNPPQGIILTVETDQPSVAFVDINTRVASCLDVVSGEARLATSIDAGANWSSMSVSLGSAPQDTSVASNGGRVYYHFADVGEVRCLYTDNLGTSWTDVSVDASVGADGGQGHIAADATQVVIAYWDDTNGAVKLARSIDSGDTWSVYTVATPGIGAGSVCVALDDGDAHIVYRDPVAMTVMYVAIDF